MPHSILSQRDQWPDRYADNNLLQSGDYDEVNSPAESQNDADFSDPNTDAAPRHQPSVNELATQVQYMRNHQNGGGSADGGAGAASSGTPGGGTSTDGGAGGTPVSTGGGVPLIKKPDGTYTSSDPEWAKLINRESGGRNIKQQITDVNSGGNEAYGLFQITPGTWTAHGGQGSVYDSTPEQQAAVAANILRKNPSGSDWGAGLAGRENAQALMKGLGSGSPGSTAPTAPGAVNAGTPAAPAGDLRQVNPSQGQGPTTGPDTHGGLLPDTQKFQSDLMKQFPQLSTPGGYRPPDGPNEHSSGHALDVMIPDAATQKQVRDWSLQQPNVNYVLNQQKQWNPDGSSTQMEDRGSPTANHYDHDHINVAGDYQPDPSATPPTTPVTPSTATTPATQPTQPTDPSSTPTPAAQPPVQPPPTQQPPPMTIAQRKRASTFIGGYH